MLYELIMKPNGNHLGIILINNVMCYNYEHRDGNDAHKTNNQFLHGLFVPFT